MAIRFRCEHCDQLLSIGTRKAGTQVHCVRCQAPLDVPSASTEMAAPGMGQHLLAAATIATFLLVLAGAGAVVFALLSDRNGPTEEEGFVKVDPPVPLPVVPHEAAPPAPVEPAPVIVPARAKPAPRGVIAANARPAAEGPSVLARAKPFRSEPRVVKVERPWKMKRIAELTDEELRKQLLGVPEINLDAIPGTAQGLVKLARGNPGADLVPLVIAGRPDLIGLPHSMGADCRLGKESADNLQAQSRKLRGHLEASLPDQGTAGRSRRPGAGPADPRPDPNVLRDRLLNDATKEWLHPEAIPALQQLFMAENKNVRLILVELLQKIPGKQAGAALAQRAVYDLHPDVRESAARALKERPRAEYEDFIVQGLSYPWAAAAEHAAEALVALECRDLVPKLVPLLDARNPAEPYLQKVARNRSIKVVRELVRVNHLANCVLCHAPSFAQSDPVRGLVPTPGQALPAPASTPAYYEGSRGTFVRADVTYLKQDFSVPQPVQKSDPWPAHQRFDYLVRLRPTSLARPSFEPRPTDSGKLTPHRRAVLFALRELTGQDVGPDSAAWQRLLQFRPAVEPTLALGLGASALPARPESSPTFFTFLGYTFPSGSAARGPR